MTIRPMVLQLIVKRLRMNFSRITYSERTGKLGLGTAYIAGFKWALTISTIMFLKWMLTSRTIRMIWSDFIMPVKLTELIWQLVRGTNLG